MRRPDQSLTKTTNPPIRIFSDSDTRYHTTCNLSSQTPKKADQKVLLDDTTRLCRNPHACLIPRARLCGPSQRKAYIQRHKKRAQRANNRPCTPCSVATPLHVVVVGGGHPPTRQTSCERAQAQRTAARHHRPRRKPKSEQACQPPPTSGRVCCGLLRRWGPMGAKTKPTKATPECVGQK